MRIGAQCSHRPSHGRMLSLEQLSQMVKIHLGLYDYTDGVQHSCKWDISDSTLGGRGLYATEDISSGEVLFVDRPLIHGPRSGAAAPRGCTVCNVQSDAFIKCEKCCLLLCSEQCQNTTTHYEDCAIISGWSNKVPIEEVDDTLLSRTLTPIRALLLNEDEKELMASLQAHMLPQHGAEIRQLKQYFDIPEEDEQLLTLACCALDTNAFQIAPAYGKKEVSIRGLYPVSGLMNHNCVPNIRYSYNTDCQMTVKAVKPIRAGAEIFSSYTGTLWGTPARRLHMYKTKHFWCRCDRCADPTERGTLLAALKCFSSECPGSLLPLEPLKSSSSWQCLDCGMRVPAKKICVLQNALGNLMASLDFQNVDQLENFLMYRVNKYIPKSNQIVVDLQCHLIWEIGDTKGLHWHGKFL
jgi:hypothetical protein